MTVSSVTSACALSWIHPEMVVNQKTRKGRSPRKTRRQDRIRRLQLDFNSSLQVLFTWFWCFPCCPIFLARPLPSRLGTSWISKSWLLAKRWQLHGVWGWFALLCICSHLQTTIQCRANWAPLFSNQAGSCWKFGYQTDSAETCMCPEGTSCYRAESGGPDHVE